MSNDKLNKQLANIIEFEGGEILTPDKLNTLVEIIDANIEASYGAIGNVYDENDVNINSSWGKRFALNTSALSAQNRELDIVNLARLIGPASALNPQAAIFAGKSITEKIPDDVYEFELKYPGISTTITISGWNKKAGGFDADNQYRALNNGRRLVFSSATANDISVTYSTMPMLYNGGPNYQGASFNVIPDPNQGYLDDSVITYDETDSSYTIDLSSFTILNQQISLSDKTTTQLDSRDINQGESFLLPEWFTSLDDNAQIPKYSLYLKNYTTSEVYLDAIYTKISNTKIKITNLSIGNQNCINGFDFRLITIGTDITRSIDDLRNKMFLHKHDGSFGEPLVSINDLAGKFESVAPSGIYGESGNTWNTLPMYLHRDGYQADTNANNGNGAMRGPLMMGLESFDPLSSTDISNDESGSSQPIYFGGTLTYIKRAGSSLRLVNEDIQSLATQTNLISGANVYATASEAVTINSDTLIAAVNDLNNQITAIQRYLLDNSVITNSTIDLSNTTGKDLLSRDVKASRLKIAVNNIELQINPGTAFIYAGTEHITNSNTNVDYVDVIGVCQGLAELNPPLATLDSTETFYLSVPDQRHLTEIFFNTDNCPDVTLTNVFLSEDHYNLFTVSKETNTSYYFKLWKYSANNNGNNRIYSPTFKINNSVKDYRPFGLFIDRATTLYLNYNDIGNNNSFDTDYIYEHEYIINIDQKMLGGGQWGGNIGLEGAADGVSYVILDYDIRKQNGLAFNLSQSSTFIPGSSSESPTLISELGINKLFATTYPIEREALYNVDGDTVLAGNSNLQIISVHGNKVFIKIAHNVYRDDNTSPLDDGEVNNPINGIMMFDKLIIKETIHNGAINVEVKPFRADWGLLDARYRYERFNDINFDEPSQG